MKIKKKFVAILALTMIIGISTQVNRCYAAEGQRDVPVTYTPTEDSVLKFNMNVIIQGDGYLLDGDQKLTGDATVFILKKGDQKAFRVVPGSDSYIKSIVFDNSDITSELKDGIIAITAKAHDTQLVITFAKNPVDDTEKDESINSGQTGNKAPETGDATSLKMITGILVTSGIVLLYAMKKKKEENESENGGD